MTVWGGRWVHGLGEIVLEGIWGRVRMGLGWGLKVLGYDIGCIEEGYTT